LLNKIDVPEARELAEFVTPDLEAAGAPGLRDLRRHPRGLAELRFALAEVVAPTAATSRAPAPRSWSGRPVDSEQFHVEPDRESTAASVSRPRPERWILQTDFNNDEAVGYLPTGLPGSASSQLAARRSARGAGDHRQRHLRLGADHAGRGRHRADGPLAPICGSIRSIGSVRRSARRCTGCAAVSRSTGHARRQHRCVDPRTVGAGRAGADGGIDGS
jgi:hypothetical protein